jgi:pimeloyl-ACP methyl ester carboxylesterase
VQVLSKPDPLEAKPVQSKIPSLFLSAEIDLGCPPNIAEMAAKRFQNGSFVMIPNTNHGVFRNSACGRKIIRQYLQDPTAKIDTSCIYPEHSGFAFVLK